MVKLYYTPTSCGASSFICAFIAGLNFDCEIVDLSTHKTESGGDFYTINPKGNVPTLILDDGTILNENISCLEYILDLSLKCDTKLGPENGTSERYLLKQNLSFIATELHPTIGLLFNPSASQDNYIREFIMKIFDKKMKYLEKYMIKDKDFIQGDSFTVIDAYLHIVLSWTGYVGIDLSAYPLAFAYKQKIFDLPYVKKARNRISEMPDTVV
jgi:glutathione S-transferase